MRRSLALAVLLACAYRPCAARVEERAATSASASVPASEQTSLFDATSLAVPMRSEDFSALFQKMTLAPKDEFETTAAYQARVAAATGNDAVHVFILEPSILEYNADRQQFRVSFDTAAEAEHMPTVVVRASKRAAGSYVGSTAMGVKGKVNREVRTYDVVRFPGRFTPDLYVPMPAAEARAGKARLRFAILCTLGSYGGQLPTTTATRHDTPTIDYAFDVDSSYRFLTAPRARIVAVDGASGAILASVDSIFQQK